MHKEKYILADMQIIEFEKEDVITTSFDENKPEDDEPIIDPAGVTLDDDESPILGIW